jgi:GNAT superfamily N-acetyltransferase
VVTDARSIAYTVSPARRSDIGPCVRLAAELLGGTVEDRYAKFLRGVQSADELLVVAHHDDQVVGYGRAELWSRPEEAPPRIAPTGWYLAGLLVAPAVRGRGIGRDLIARRLDWLAQRTADVWYFTNARNRISLRLHADFGFER